MRSLIWVFLLLLPATLFAQSQCQSSDPPNCAIYTQCFESHCRCANTNSPYSATFGPKYCNAFSAAPALSTNGKAWRDRTLRCLTDRASEAYAAQPESACNCTSFQDAMVSSHTPCYTAGSPSFCGLSDADLRQVATIVNAGDLWNLRNGLTETAKTFIECVKQVDVAPSLHIVRVFATQMIADGGREAAHGLLGSTATLADQLASSSPGSLKKRFKDFAAGIRELQKDLFPIVHP